MPKKKWTSRKNCDLHETREQQQPELKSLQDIFGSNIEHQIIVDVFKQCDCDVEKAAEELYLMLPDVNGIDEVQTTDGGATAVASFNNHVYESPLYESNEDLYTTEDMNKAVNDFIDSDGAERMTSPSAVDDLKDIFSPQSDFSVEDLASDIMDSSQNRPQELEKKLSINEAGKWNVEAPSFVPFQVVSGQSTASLLIKAAFYKIDRGEKVLVVLRGLPGSGKSTLAKKMKRPNGVICSTDDFFMHRNVYCFDQSRLGEAHEFNQERVKKFMKNNVTPIIIDNTNIERWEMKPYVANGLKYGYSIEILEPDTSWKFKIKELTLKNKHNISKEKIELMLDRYEHNVTVGSIMKHSFRKKHSSNPEEQKQLFSYLASNNGTSDYATNDSSFWEPKDMNGEKRSADVKSKISSPAKRDRRDRHQQGELTTVAAIKKVCGGVDVVQRKLEFCLEDDKRERNLNSESDNIRKNCENDKVLDRNIFTNVWCDAMDEDKITKKTTPSVKTFATVDSHLWQNSSNWSMPSFPEGKITSNNEAVPQEEEEEEEEEEVRRKDVTTQVSSKDLLTHFNGIILLSRPYDINVDSTVSQFICCKPGMLEKSTMTEQEIERGDSEDRFEFLKELFPSIPVDSLLDLFKKCDENIEWTSDVLLESERQLLFLQPSTHKKLQYDNDELSNAIDDALELFSSDTQAQFNDDESSDWSVASVETAVDQLGRDTTSSDSSEMNDALCEKLKDVKLLNEIEEKLCSRSADGDESEMCKMLDARKESVTKIENLPEEESKTRLNVDTDQLVLRLDAAFVMQLEELFGSLHRPQIYELPYADVRVPKSVCYYLFECLKQNSLSQIGQENISFGQQFKPDEDFQGTKPKKNLQLDNSPAKSLSSTPTKKRYQFEHSNLKVSTEVNQWKKCDDQSLANKIRISELFKKYPTLDERTFNEIHAANNFSLPETEKMIQESLVDADIMTDAQLNCQLASKGQRSAVSKQNIVSGYSLRSFGTKKSVNVARQGDINVHPSSLAEVNQLRSEVSAQRLREEALFYQELREVNIRNSHRAREKGDGTAALQYSKESYKYLKLRDETNYLASMLVLVHQNKDKNDTTLDLHLQKSSEAVYLLSLFLKRHLWRLQRNNELQIILVIITGKGIHSRKKTPILKPVVEQYLSEKNLRFRDLNGGAFEVVLSKNFQGEF